MSCTRMSALGDLDIIAYKIGVSWDRAWRWKEKVKEISMEVMKVPFLADQSTLQSITCMNPFIIYKMKEPMMENMS